MSTQDPSKVLLAVDIETTGTDKKKDVILEVAIAAIDIETLVFIDSYRSVILPDGQLQMDDFVTRMHTTNGLLEEIRKGEGLGANKVYVAVKEFAEKYPNSMLLGRNVGSFDKAFLEEKSPGIFASTSYRNVDFSSVREFFKIAAPQYLEGAPPKPEGHRALSDIEGDVLLLKFLKKGLNVDVAALAKVGSDERAELLGHLVSKDKGLLDLGEALEARESRLLDLCIAAGVEAEEDLLPRVRSLVELEKGVFEHDGAEGLGGDDPADAGSPIAE